MPRGIRKTKRNIIYGVGFLVGLCIFFLDFFIKNYLHSKAPITSIPIIENILHITLVFNRGGIFGILKGKVWFLILVSILFLVFFIFFIKKERNKNLFFWIGSGFIFGGAVSNLVDRIFFGYVIDYIDIKIWPVFNLSDLFINLGVGILFLNHLKNVRKKIICI